MVDVENKSSIKYLIIKWCGKEYKIEWSESDTISTLKNEIHKQTGVRPDRQKLLNLKFKGKTPDDDCRIEQLELKENFKVMMMGSLEEQINEVNTAPEDLPEVLNDFATESEVIAISKQECNLSKIQKRIENYNIKMLNEPRPNKSLLVLDIDYTLFDHRSVAERGDELMRPYLHEFLTAAYEHYDIVIWSATNMKWIEEKMKLLGVSRNENYKIIFYLDSAAMISVTNSKNQLVDVKPLGVIWGKFPQYTPKNTIMFDDIRHNFLMNPKNGLRIRPFRQAHLNRATDKELLNLSKYLTDLALHCDDFSKVDHRHWEKFKPSKKRKSGSNDL